MTTKRPSGSTATSVGLPSESATTAASKSAAASVERVSALAGEPASETRSAASAPRTTGPRKKALRQLTGMIDLGWSETLEERRQYSAPKSANDAFLKGAKLAR